MRQTIRYYAPGSGLKRPHVPLEPAERIAIHGLQGARCYLCGRPFNGRLDARLRATEDHVWPKSRGGQDYRNRLLAHYDCNIKKDDRKAYPCELLLCDAIWTRLLGEVTSNEDSIRRR